jgi:hypothetical protein
VVEKIPIKEAIWDGLIAEKGGENMATNDKMENAKYQNVYQRSSDTRRKHRDGKIDVCYYIIYRHNGKKIW